MWRDSIQHLALWKFSKNTIQNVKIMRNFIWWETHGYICCVFLLFLIIIFWLLSLHHYCSVFARMLVLVPNVFVFYFVFNPNVNCDVCSQKVKISCTRQFQDMWATDFGMSVATAEQYVHSAVKCRLPYLKYQMSFWSQTKKQFIDDSEKNEALRKGSFS